jgi:hypothetical protein
MIPQEYREFFTAAAGAAGALIGLLFVAITVSPERARQVDTRTEFRVRASTALLVFSNALTLSLAALVPGVSLGWWCLVSSLGMLVFAFATTRSGIAEIRRRPAAWRPFTTVAGLLVLIFFEILAGVQLVRDESSLNATQTLNYVIIADLLMGIGRAWQLASMRETGLLNSLRVLALGEQLPEEEEEEDNGDGEADDGEDPDGSGRGTVGA